MEQDLSQWRVQQALHSYSTLLQVSNVLTEAEVLAALDIESKTQRRRSIIDRLIARASRLNEINYTKQLKEKYRGNSPLLEDHGS